MMSTKSKPATFKILSRWWVWILPWLPLVAIWAIFIAPANQPGLIVGSDWIFPYTHEQLRAFAAGGWSLWSNQEIPTGTQTPHHNIYLFQLFAGLCAALGMDGIAFQRLVIVVILIAIYFSAYILIKEITRNQLGAIVGATVYLFSPVVFNYFNMGWWFVLLYMAIAPIFTLLAHRYLSTGNLGIAMAAGILSSIAFLQAQAIAWLPILASVVAISQLGSRHYKLIFIRWLGFLTIIMIITLVVHSAWMIPLFLHPEKYLSATTSANDLSRFESIANISNQLRGWGSLFNEHFELSFDKNFQFASYVFVAIALGLLFLPNSLTSSSGLLLGILLILTPATLFMFRYQIAWLPFSNIVRDVSRFIVISNLGFAIIAGIFFSKVSKWQWRLIALGMILLSIHPYLLGRLDRPDKILYGNSKYGKDQRIRLLEVPQNEIESVIRQVNSSRGLLFPTGGFVSSQVDRRFDQTFSEISDYDALFSPYATGIFVSDKSNPAIGRFARNYIDSAVKEPRLFEKLSRLYGIDTIFVRQGLYSSFDRKLDHAWRIPSCINTGNNSSDWSISQICPISDPYPTLFASPNPIKATTQEFDQLIESNSDSGQIGYLATIRCPETTDYESNNCQLEPEIFKSGQPPRLEVQPLSKTEYRVNIEKISSPVVLVLNQTYHPGWVVKNTLDNRRLEYSHVLVNELVNGWIIPAGEQKELQIQFYPQKLFSKLIYFSLGGLAIISMVTGYLLIKKRPEQQDT